MVMVRVKAKLIPEQVDQRFYNKLYILSKVLPNGCLKVVVLFVLEISYYAVFPEGVERLSITISCS